MIDCLGAFCTPQIYVEPFLGEGGFHVSAARVTPKPLDGLFDC
jgi:hypothetical protein